MTVARAAVGVDDLVRDCDEIDLDAIAFTERVGELLPKIAATSKVLGPPGRSGSRLTSSSCSVSQMNSTIPLTVCTRPSTRRILRNSDSRRNPQIAMPRLTWPVGAPPPA